MIRLSKTSLALLCFLFFSATPQDPTQGRWMFGTRAAFAENGALQGDDGRAQTGNGAQQGGRKSVGSIPDLNHAHSNGWVELIRDNEYVLIDPNGQTVTRRKATMQDVNRLRGTD